MSFISAKHIVKNYSSHCALNDVSITIPDGAIYGLLGPNGAGKTTLIRIINQITAPDSGELFFNGRPIKPSDVENIGYLPEERGLYKKMKVGEQAIYLARLKGLSRSDATKRLREWFKKFDILPWWDKKVEELSKGMAQKIQFITTVLHEPQLLIFDEPFSGFDPINVELLKREILELKSKGATIIFSTHNMASVEEICSDIALINHSQKVIEGKVDEIRNQHANDIFRFCYHYKEGFAPETLLGDEFDLINSTLKESTQEIVIKKKCPVEENLLLRRAIEHVDIISYDKVIPSMNDIFIKLVKGI